MNTGKLEDMKSTLLVIKTNTEAKAAAKANISKWQITILSGVMAIVAVLAPFILKWMGG